MLIPIYDASDIHILVVDDKPSNLRLLNEILPQKGFYAHPVPNANLALATLERVKIDLILLDILMPEVDGYTLCQIIKENPKIKHIPVIFITAIDEILDRGKAFTVGGEGYITKPFHFQELFTCIDLHLERHWLRQKLLELAPDLLAPVVDGENPANSQ
ncbi:MAG: response regulator [Pseudanabaena sp. ELA607]|jgi:DNA-binding response OmpR family regulator